MIFKRFIHMLILCLSLIILFPGCDGGGSGDNPANEEPVKVATPVFSPGAGTFDTDQSVTIQCNTADDGTQLANDIRRKGGYAPESGYHGTGLSNKEQDAIMNSLGDGEIIAVRKRAEGSHKYDGILDAKAPGDKAVGSGTDGFRVLDDGTYKVSDLDFAFVTNSDLNIIDYKKIKIKINENYGHRIVTHGDNYTGAMDNIKGALKVQKENDFIFLFDKNGLVKAGRYKKMVRKNIRK